VAKEISRYPKRPTWCWVADAQIKGDAHLHLTPRLEESARLKWAQNMENQARESLKTPRLYKKEAKGSQKI